MSEIKTMRVIVQFTPEREYETIRYRRLEDGWYVDDGSGFEVYADREASERTIRQLINKEYDETY